MNLSSGNIFANTFKLDTTATCGILRSGSLQKRHFIKMGRAELIITDEHKAITERMAKAGMTAEMIAKACGMCRRTFFRKPELREIYQRCYIETIEKVSDALIAKALQGDTNLMIFVMKTRGGWKEYAPPLSDEFPNKTHAEKQLELDEMLACGHISVDGYTKLTQSLTSHYQIVEHEKRINELEKVATMQKNNGANAAARNAALANDNNKQTEDNQGGETNNGETQENTGESIRVTE